MWTRINNAWKALAAPNAPSNVSAYKSYNSFDYWMGMTSGSSGFPDSDTGLAQMYAMLGVVYAAVNKWSNWVGGQEWVLKNHQSKEVVFDSTDTYLADNERVPNFALAVRDYESWSKQSLFGSITFSNKLYAETYLSLVRGNRRRDTLQWINPIQIEPYAPQGQILYYNRSGDDGSLGQLPVDDVVFLIYARHPTKDFRGYPPLLSVRTNGNIEFKTKHALLNYFTNGMILGGVITPKGESHLMPPEINRFQDDLQRKQGGVVNAHKWLVSPLDMNFTQFQQPDLQKNLGVLERLSSEILSVLDVPPQLLGDTSDSTYDNAKDIETGWIRNSTVPYLKQLAENMNRFVIPRFDTDVYIEFQTAKYETEAPETVATDLNAGIIPIAIAQAKRGYEVDSDLDDIYMVNNRPMTKTILLELANMLPPEYQAATATNEAPPGDDKPTPDKPNDSAQDEQGENEDGKPTESETDDLTDNPLEDKKAIAQTFGGAESTIITVAIVHADTLDIHTEEHQHTHDLPDIEEWDYTPEKAKAELVVWQKHVQKGVKREFTPKYLRGDFADTLQAVLRTGDSAGIKAAFDSIFLAFKQSGVDYQQEMFLDCVKGLLNGDIEAIKDIQAIRLDFEMRFDDILAAIRDGSIESRARAGTLLRGLIRVFGSRAYRQGMADGGVMDAPTDEEQAEIDSLVKAQSGYVSGLTQVLMKDGGISDAQALNKAAMWFNGAAKPMYYAGLASAKGNMLMEARLGKTERHCRDCPRLAGQRHRLKHWKAKNLLLGNAGQATECKGFLCDCGLFAVTGRARGKF